ncbi:hypothetical protein FRB99_002992 [Tulasnella sp. 403]|nr:hypothetical protein FRB99_002992 [Tulasnella sp. 403]
MTVGPPVYDAPKVPPKWDELPIDEAIQQLKSHLQTAVLIELYTIPMYLYAAYSIKDNPQATWKIINVVKQEMLHLGLSGNILCSIGGTPRVFGDAYTPTYPATIFYEDQVQLDLKPATTEVLETFMRVEQPELLEVVMLARGNILPDYNSIGAFYQHTKRGVATLSQRMDDAGRRLFLPSTFPRQFNTQDGSWSDSDMAVITSASVAEAAMEVIIEQGEGATSKGDNIPSGIQSHYEVFRDLHHLSEEGKVPYHNVVENIDPSNYTEEKFHGLMIACDAAYSYLLMTIEAMWQYDGELRGRLVTNNIMNLMLTVLRPIALFLVAQEITSGPDQGKHAGPPFRQHNFQNGRNGALEELKQLTRDALAQYPDVTALKGVQADVDALIDLGRLPSN